MKEYYKFAEQTFEIDHYFPQFEKFAKNYTTNDTENPVNIVATLEDSEAWKKNHQNEEIDFPLAYLETLVVQSKIADYFAKKNTFIFHGSTFYLDDPKNSFILTAPSGTGKSTHARLLKEMLGERINYVNDDKPFISIKDNKYNVYGSPWDGKEHRSNNLKGVLRGIFIVERSKTCDAVQISGKEAIMYLIKQIHIPTGLENTLAGSEFIVNLCKNVPIYILKVDMSMDAPKTSYKIMKKLMEEN